MARTVILTIEDDPAIRCGIVDSLEYSGHQVLQAGDGSLGLEMALKSEYDLLLLDLALPEISGLEILKKLKRARPTQPVIILTAKGGEQDRVQGLRDGADDYVVKPFSIKELLARVEAVLRRSPERPRDVQSVNFSGGVVDFERREVRFASQESSEGEPPPTRVELSEKETELIQYLVANSELLSSVWRLSPKGITTRTIDMHVARLREKMRENKATKATVLTVRGKGYMWSVCEKGGS